MYSVYTSNGELNIHALPLKYLLDINSLLLNGEADRSH